MEIAPESGDEPVARNGELAEQSAASRKI
jgi:hypothetical protein